MRKRWRRKVIYPLLGLLVSLTAPVGWLLLHVRPRLFVHPSQFFAACLTELRSETDLYLYMQISAGITIMFAGFWVGWLEDRLRQQFNRVVSQHRLLGMKNRQLARLSITDRLTGLANYSRFHERLGQEFKRARRYNLELSVLVVDVDNFKEVNDRHGHPFGDYVLHECGQIFASTLRESDYVARTGGEEFCFLLTQTPLEDALRFGERVRTGVFEHSFEHNARRAPITISVGVASVRDLPSSVTDEESKQLYSFADQALYKAKRQGRNRVERYAPPSIPTSVSA